VSLLIEPLLDHSVNWCTLAKKMTFSTEPLKNSAFSS
jgi:hypothetical protein